MEISELCNGDIVIDIEHNELKIEKLNCTESCNIRRFLFNTTYNRLSPIKIISGYPCPCMNHRGHYCYGSKSIGQSQLVSISTNIIGF